MKGLFIPEITAEMFRNGCLESIEALMAEGEIYDIEYEPKQRTGKWILVSADRYIYRCDVCEKNTFGMSDFCPNCGAQMKGE